MIEDGFEWKRWIVLSFLFAIPCAAATAAEKELTIDRISSLPSLTGTPPARPVWSRTSDRVAFLWNDRGYPFYDVWVASASGGDPIRITDLNRGSNEPEAIAVDSDPLAALTRAFQERTRSGVSEVIWTPSGDALVFSFDGQLHRVSAGGGPSEPITRWKAFRASLAYSPDGRFLSWVQDGDLWLWRDGETEPVRATNIGLPPIGFIPGARYNRPDRGISSYRWSPDGRHVALEVDDLRNVRKEAIPNYIGPETEVRHLRRDYPGDNDQVRAIQIYAVATGRLATVPLEDPTYRLINAYSWSPAKPSRLLIDQVSEDAVDRRLWLVDAEKLEVAELWHDSRETRNSARLTTSLWRSDGAAVLFTADLDGRHRLHSLSIEDRTLRTLTAGDWSVVSPAFGGAWVEVSPARKEVFFVSTQKSPYERQVYRMPESGGTVTQVTALPGVHEPTLSPDGSRLALLHSNDTSPRELYLNEGRSERRLTESPPAEFRDYEWAEARYITFPSQVDDATLHGRLMEPPDLDRTKKYPAILGPVYSNTVRNQWPGSNGTFQQYLAQHGYLVLQVDIRGSSGYGRKFREDLFLDYGGIDVEDLASGAAYLKSLPYVDPERVGIWGWSYGGLLTSMSLFKKPGVYRAGVAGAPATYVWHALTGQTENIRKPSTHPEVYRKSSSSSYGENLQDHLMIIHGLQDDVVLFKDSVTLAEKLTMLGKNFDFVILPSATHSFGARDYVARFVYTKVAEHFDRYLGGGPRSISTETLDGAWKLESYQLQEKDVPVSGVMLFADGRFAMVYTMDYQGRSGRAHGGEYRLEGDRIIFDIPWWIQRVPGEPQVMDRRREAGALVERKDDSLTLAFDGGSVQVLRKLPSKSNESLDGAWRLDSYQGSARTGPTSGIVIFRDGYFALVYTMTPEGGLDGRSHAGTFARDGGALSLTVNWEVVSISGQGTVADKTYTRETGVSVESDGLTLDYGKGAKQTFHRAGR